MRISSQGDEDILASPKGYPRKKSNAQKSFFIIVNTYFAYIFQKTA